MHYADRIAEQVNQLGQCPLPSDAAIKHSELLYSSINSKLEQGPMAFVELMHELLYAPGLGYYSAGSAKLGVEGDFITAPEISPLFGQAMANQCQQILMSISAQKPKAILEFGAGTGKLAADVLDGLAQLEALPDNYFILEVSADLIERQQSLLKSRHPEYFAQIQWLTELPENFSGVMLANEVLDAMPVHRFRLTEQGFKEEYVVLDEQGNWQLIEGELSANLKAWLSQPEVLALPVFSEGTTAYQSEVNLAQQTWLESLSNSLDEGAVILIDYGFPQKEYYLPERSAGTLMCHYRHRAHDNPLILAGLQDITAHVDFTAVAESALDAGLEVMGYTNQAAFLMGCGILQLAEGYHDPDDIQQQLTVSGQMRQLMMPEEMGELFKVMVLSKNLNLTQAIGCAMSDLRHQL